MPEIQGNSQVDRLDGVNQGIAKKAPVRVATTAELALPLSGLQTIDGVTLVEGDRVLVKDQTNLKLNGIYNASTGNWIRTLDANGNRDLVDGSTVLVDHGTTLTRTTWALVATNPVILDSSDLTWVQLAGGGGGGPDTDTLDVVVPVEFSVNTPVTLPGPMTIDKAVENANTVWAGPTSGSPAKPTFRALVAPDIPTNIRTVAIEFEIWGNGAPIGTGVQGDIEITFNCTLQRVTLLADQTGSIVIDIWKDSYGNYPPTSGDSITAGTQPTISSGIKYQDSTLSGWATTISAGDIIRYSVSSCSTITRCLVSLKAIKT